MRVHLIVIDPQFDFCDPSGALYVQGAEKDIVNLANMVKRLGSKLDDIHVTLDSHHLVDIAHPIFWLDSGGNHPKPFTIISEDDVTSGRFTTTNPAFLKRATEYVKGLAKNNRYPLCIWNPHCLIGSNGYKVVEELFVALREWEQKCFAMVNYVTKGSNLWTEHYSAVQADVPDPSDPGTMLNTDFISTLQEADMIALAGEAKDFCVFNTLKDIVDNFGSESGISKIHLLTDATSTVLPSKPESEKFYKDMISKGMKMTTTIDFLK